MYRSDLDRLQILQSCPCSDCQEVEDMDAFRFMYEPLDNPSNFVPQLLKAEEEGRVVRTYIETPDKTCDAMGLSFFTTAHFALATYNSLRGLPKLNPRYTTLGKCKLTNADGVISSASRSGHFNVHPYEDAPMQSSFEVVAPLAL